MFLPDDVVLNVRSMRIGTVTARRTNPVDVKYELDDGPNPIIPTPSNDLVRVKNRAHGESLRNGLTNPQVVFPIETGAI